MDLSIPPLYCGAKYHRAGSRESDIHLLKNMSPEKEAGVYRVHAGNATFSAPELLDKD